MPLPLKPSLRRAGWLALAWSLTMPSGAASAAETPGAPPLPVRDVVLFSSGVGYYQHAGQVNGPATLDFRFRVEQINDLLKSLVLFDPAGQVRPVTYPANDPLSRGLAGLGIQLNGSNPLGALLRQFQGVQVRVETANRTLTGRILSVSVEQKPTDKGPVPVDVLNLLSEGSFVSLPMSEIQKITVLDPALQAKLQNGLDLLASGLDRDQKTVSVHFGGDRAREVRMGYLLESPVWKTSYRLVLGDAKATPYMQGWAIVENMTDQDWNGVNLSLVSGRPVSFVQDLYTPLYVSRPRVAPQVIGSAAPIAYDADFDEDGQVFALEPEGIETVGGLAASPPPPGAPLARKSAMPGLQSESLLRDSFARERRENVRAAVENLAQSVSAQAQGEERGELFEYAIQGPVTIPSRQSAMVPILGADLSGEQVSIYTPEVNPQHPMNGVRLKNTTGLHLAGGPITVYDDGVYAGDAIIENLQPGEDRLLSFSVDLQVEGKHEVNPLPEDLITVKADSGLLRITRKLRREHNYTLKNKDDEARTVIIQQPIVQGWELVKPAKADEKTASHYRFKVNVPANNTGKFTAVVEHQVTDSVALLNADVDFLLQYAGNAKLSQKMRAALGELVQLRRRITDIQGQIQAAEAEIAAITSEQARIRENMGRLDRQSPLYQQYVRKLTDQEARIEELRAKIEQLRQQENAAREALRKYLDTLDIQ